MIDRYSATVTNVTATAHMSLDPNGKYVSVAECMRLEGEIMRLLTALSVIATPPRPDGTWNRDRQACYELAKQELERTP